MSRKKRIGISILILSLLVLISCGKKEKTIEDIGPLFVENFIYHKESETFKETFVDGDLLEKQLTLLTNTFEINFEDVFDPITGNLSDQEREEISTNLMSKMQEMSSYEYKVVEDKKNYGIIDYHIKGFDYARLIELTMDKLMDKMRHDESIKSGTPESKEAVMTSFFDALDNSKSCEEEVTVSLTFESSKKKWQLSDKQDDAVNRLLLAFVSGTNSQQEYDERMNEAIKRAVDRAQKTL
ncbi:MAG: DUF5105 domain-containing protein [Vagococcus sp.]